MGLRALEDWWPTMRMKESDGENPMSEPAAPGIPASAIIDIVEESAEWQEFAAELARANIRLSELNEVRAFLGWQLRGSSIASKTNETAATAHHGERGEADFQDVYFRRSTGVDRITIPTSDPPSAHVEEDLIVRVEPLYPRPTAKRLTPKEIKDFSAVIDRLRAEVQDEQRARATQPVQQASVVGEREALEAYVTFAAERRAELGVLSPEMEAVDAQARAALASKPSAPVAQELTEAQVNNIILEHIGKISGLGEGHPIEKLNYYRDLVRAGAAHARGGK